jgi:hypothetical protein
VDSEGVYLPKKKKPVETIKIEGLSPETVKEFEPREDSQKDDALWERYFKGTPNLLKLPTKKDDQLEISNEKISLNKNVTMSTPVRTEVDTGANTTVKISVGTTQVGEQKPRDEYISLDATHTAMEAKIYSIIYRETVVKGNEPQHFGASRLMSLTGIGSDKTVRKAIKSLIAKRSIALVDPCPNHPLGAVYRAFSPKEIIAARKKAGIKIHAQTKKIIYPETSSNISTGVDTGVGTVVDTQVSTVVTNTPITTVENTPVSPVKNTGVQHTTPYIYNYINSDDNSDKIFNHKSYVVSLYERYTRNRWKISDDEFYENKKLGNIIPDIIEAAIITSVLRSKTKINSLAYTEGVIYEFQEKFPLGYLSYLRTKWKDIKEKRASTHKDPSERGYEWLKREIERIMNIVQQVRVGGGSEISLMDDVKAYCKKENVPFDEEVYKELLEEPKHSPMDHK